MEDKNANFNEDYAVCAYVATQKNGLCTRRKNWCLKLPNKSKTCCLCVVKKKHSVFGSQFPGNSVVIK